MLNVSRVSGTFGVNSSGSDCGNSPSSPTVGTVMAIIKTIALTRTIATSGAGITLVRRGMPIITSRPRATNQYTANGTPIRCGS